MPSLPNVVIFAVCFGAAPLSSAAVTVGILSDFESGTTEGWGGGASPMNIATGGPGGIDDNFLQVGNGGSLATHNTSLNGLLDPAVSAILVDMRRPAGESDLAMRLFLLRDDNGQVADRWASNDFVTVPGDGIWRTYQFPVREPDFTQVSGTAPYSATATSLNRLMFRYNPGPPVAGNTGPVPGTLGIDNVTAIPEPSAAFLSAISAAMIGLARSRGARRSS